jgi:predicted MPP superfamily phosphohydrolase
MKPKNTNKLNLLLEQYLMKITIIVVRYKFLLLLPLLFFLLSESIATDGYNSFYQVQNSSKEYVFISDTQGMLTAEYLWNITNNNKAVRQLLFSDIIEHNPRSVFHMGDLVTEGYHNPSWNTIDIFLDSLSEKEIPFYPVMGNHELIFMPERGEKNFQKRFPQHSRTGYSVRVDSLAVILLNSNFGKMSEDEITKQNNWYNKTLDELDSDSSIQMIAVGTHYSPYTNSKRVSPSKDVQQYFVPGYLNSKKAKLFLSGHTHAFEHFIIEGKNFLVIGGGGGPQQPLSVGEDAMWKDNFNSEDKYRRFHYIRLVKEADDYIVNVIMIDSTYSKLANTYQIR